MAVLVKGGGGENVTPEVTAQTPVITQILEGLVGKAQGANATAETILKGFSAYVGQELVDGAFDKSECLDALLAGDFTVGAVDKFTFAEDMTIRKLGFSGNYALFNHSLGITPRMAILTGKNITKNGNSYILTSVTVGIASGTDYEAIAKCIGKSYAPTADGTIFSIDRSDPDVKNSNTQVAIYFGPSFALEAGKEYILITMA